MQCSTVQEPRFILSASVCSRHVTQLIAIFNYLQSGRESALHVVYWSESAPPGGLSACLHCYRDSVCPEWWDLSPPNNNSVLWFLYRTQFSGAFKVCWYSPSWLVSVRWLDEWNDMWRGQQCEREEDDEDGRNREWMWTCYRWFNDNVDGVTGKLNVWRIRTSFLFYLLTDWVVGCFSGCFMSVYFYYASQPPPHACVDRL